MALSTVLFGLMAVCIRLASKQLHPFEIAFFRNFFGFVILLPILVRHGPSLLRTDKLGFYIGRCSIGMVSMLAGFWAIVNLPLAQAIALSYSTPLFVTIGAVIVLGEIVRARRWSAVIVGFLGVLVIVRPGTTEFTVDALQVKEIRKATGLTQAKFAAMIDVQLGTLRNWEQGRREPTGPAKALLRASLISIEPPLRMFSRASSYTQSKLYQNQESASRRVGRFSHALAHRQPRRRLEKRGKC